MNPFKRSTKDWEKALEKKSNAKTIKTIHEKYLGENNTLERTRRLVPIRKVTEKDL